MDQDWQAGELIAGEEPSFPRKREPRASGEAGADWAALQALIFTANGLAG